MKYYAVKKGHQTGIFDNWTACQEATKGFSGPEFKSFNTKEEAEAYLKDKDVWKELISKDNADGYLVAFVDGSFDKDLHRYSYGAVLICPNGSEESICGHGSNKEGDMLISQAGDVPSEIYGRTVTAVFTVC